YNLSASSGNLQAATSNVFSVETPVPTGLVFPAALSGATAGQALTNFDVNVVDQFGSPYTGQNFAITIAANGPGSIVAGATTVTTTNATATFTGLTMTSAGNYTFTATASGVPAQTS